MTDVISSILPARGAGGIGAGEINTSPLTNTAASPDRRYKLPHVRYIYRS